MSKFELGSQPLERPGQTALLAAGALDEPDSPGRAGSRLAAGYLGRAAGQDKREFSRREKKTLLKILRERGGKRRAASGNQAAWDKELNEHYRVLKERRDRAFRLARLAALDLKPKDQELVASLRGETGILRRRYKRLEGLSEKQARLIDRLEVRYWEQRIEATEQMIEGLVKRFKLKPPSEERWEEFT